MKPKIPYKCTLKKTQLFLIEILGFEEDKEDNELRGDEGDELRDEEGPQISVNALSGVQGFQTMRVTGMSGKTPLHILLDLGRTHNFLDISMAKKLGCTIEETPAQVVIVADGSRLQCLYVCKGLR